MFRLVNTFTVLCICATLITPNKAIFAEDALATDSSFRRAEQYLSQQGDSELDFNDTLALQSILIGLSRAAEKGDAQTLLDAIQHLNLALGNNSRLSLAPAVTPEGIPGSRERILTVALLKESKPWRKIYLNWESLSLSSQARIGITKEDRAKLAEEPTRRLFLVTPLEVILRPLFAGAGQATFPEGETFIKYGSEPDNVYMVLKGQVRVKLYDNLGNIMRDPAGDQTTLTLGEGSILGEIAVHRREGRAADVEAGEGLVLAQLDADTFRKKLDADPEALAAVSKISQQRRDFDNISVAAGLAAAAGPVKIDSGPGLTSRVGVDAAPHALYDVLNFDMKEMENLSIADLQKEMEELRKRKREFYEDFAKAEESIKALVHPKGSSEAIRHAKEAEILWDFAQKQGIETMEPDECSMLFLAFRERQEFPMMVSLYQQSRSAAFRSSPLIREYLARALLETGQADKSLRVIQSLINEKYASSQVYYLLSRIHIAAYEKQMALVEEQKVTNPKAAAAHKKLAKEAYENYVKSLENGFYKDFEFYPGVKLLDTLLSRGGESVWDPEEVKKVATFVQFSALKGGGLYANDLATATTLLRTSIILESPSDMKRSLSVALRLADKSWKLKNTIRTLQKFRKQLIKVGDSRVASVDKALEALRSRAQELEGKDLSKGALESTQTQQIKPLAIATKEVREDGFGYGEVQSNSVRGNIPRGGQLHAHVVNPWDIAVAKKILDRLDLLHEADVYDFNRKVDERLRKRFGTKELEDLHSQEHKEYDEFILKLLDVLGVRKADDSRTNVMMDCWMGRGDCRPHAYVKQLLFDVWKSEQINKSLRAAHKALNAGAQEEYDRHMKEAQRLQRMHMLVFNGTLKSKIKMNGKYNEVLDSQGRRLVDTELKEDELNAVEDHTMNIFFELDDDGNMKYLKTACAFYQEHYAFGGQYAMFLEPLDILTGRFRAGTISAFNEKTGQMEEVPLYLYPTRYTGGREKTGIEKNADEYGQVRLRGIPIAGSINEDSLDEAVASFLSPNNIPIIRRFAEKVRAEALPIPKPPSPPKPPAPVPAAPMIGKKARLAALFVSDSETIATVRDSAGLDHTVNLVPADMRSVDPSVSLISDVQWDEENLLLGLEGIAGVSENHLDIVRAMLAALSQSPPQFYFFSTPVEDFFGFASPESHAIGLFGDFSEEPIAVFHEIGEYLIASGLMEIRLKDGELKIKLAGLGGTPGLLLDKDSLEIARKNPESHHYLLRAMQRLMFGDADAKLTARIKAVQMGGSPARIRLAENRAVKLYYTGPMIIGLGQDKTMELISREDLQAHYPEVIAKFPSLSRASLRDYYLLDPENPLRHAPVPLNSLPLRLSRGEYDAHARVLGHPKNKMISVEDQGGPEGTYYSAPASAALIRAEEDAVKENVAKLSDSKSAVNFTGTARAGERGYAVAHAVMDETGRIVGFDPKNPQSVLVLKKAFLQMPGEDYKYREKMDSKLSYRMKRVLARTMQKLNQDYLRQAAAFFGKSVSNVEEMQKESALRLWTRIREAIPAPARDWVVVVLDKNLPGYPPSRFFFQGVLKELRSLAKHGAHPDIILTAGPDWNDMKSQARISGNQDDFVLVTSQAAESSGDLEDVKGSVPIAALGMPGSEEETESFLYARLILALRTALDLTLSRQESDLIRNRGVLSLYPRDISRPLDFEEKDPVGMSL